MKRLLVSTVCALALIGCHKGESPSPTAQKAEQPSTASAQTGTAAAPGAAANATIQGTVAETIDGAGYTYVRLKTASGDVWAAVPETKLEKGQPIAIDVQLENENFHSSALNRTFDRLIFGTVAGQGGASAGASAGQLPPGHPSMKGAAGQGYGPGAMRALGADETGEAIHVEKAKGPNAKTVAELFAGRKGLKDAKVSVRGKVVKFLPQILGKNWVHLRDGSGSAAQGNEDLTVTTQDTAKVGDVVTATGTVHVDKDYGAGYRYPVILEDAKIAK